jgi:hypothetical protein
MLWMSLDNFLHFIFKHNATIIEVLIGLTLLGALFLAIRSFLMAKDPAAATGSLDLGNLESTLKQIIEKAGQMPATGSSEDSQKLLNQISDLKTQLELRQKEIEEIRANPVSASVADGASGGGLSDDEKRKLEAQIAELNGKLTEYEIISEDIADLSFYKEQNAKLQKELDALKSAGGGAAPAPSAPVSQAAAGPVQPPGGAPSAKKEPAIVGRATSAEEEAVAATESSPASAPEVPAAATESAGPDVNVVDDDLMAEFAAAVEKQKSGEASSAAVGSSETSPPLESAAPISPDSTNVNLGQMDIDKMMAEAAVIKSDVPDVDPEKSLGAGLDESKLLQEAAALEGVTPEDKKLMGDFENFVKKSES